MSDPHTLNEAPQGLEDVLPSVVDHVALARLYGEPLFAMPRDLYIPPDALQIFLEAFEGPLDLLLYLIRKQNFNILDIPMAAVTRQYLTYVDEIRASNLELAAEYLLMAAMLIEIKSRMLLPPKKTAEGEEAEDPRAELVRRLLEYEQMKLAAHRLADCPQYGRDFLRARAEAKRRAAVPEGSTGTPDICNKSAMVVPTDFVGVGPRGARWLVIWIGSGQFIGWLLEGTS